MERARTLTPRILVVEDDPDIGMLLVDLLQRQGYEPLLARNGAEALTYLQTHHQLPQLIVLDLAMPNIDGRTFFATLTTHHAWHAVPVIVISALPRAAVTAMEMGGTAFVAKPFDVAQLLRIVASCCLPVVTG